MSIDQKHGRLVIWVRNANKSRCAIDVGCTSEVDHVKKSCQYVNIINGLFLWDGFGLGIAVQTAPNPRGRTCVACAISCGGSRGRWVSCWLLTATNESLATASSYSTINMHHLLQATYCCTCTPTINPQTQVPVSQTSSTTLMYRNENKNRSQI